MDWKLELIPVPVKDVEQAKHFYNERLGFTVDHDTRVSDTVRFVQLTPPGSACSIVIGAATETPPGMLHGLQLVVDDIAAARTRLLDNGVDASKVQHFGESGLADGPGDRWNSFVFFKDPDGNSWVLQERPAE